MLLNGRGNIIGHTTLWQIISLFRDTKKAEKKKRLKMPEEAPLEAFSPHEIWFCDIRYLVKHRRNLMESHFSIEYRLLDSYVQSCIELKEIQRQHVRFIEEYNHSGHWHHKAYTEDGRIYYKSPNNIMGITKGDEYTPQELSKTFAFKRHQRVVSLKGQIRVLGYTLYVDEGLAGELIDVYIYPECLQIEHNKQMIVEYECHYDIQTKQLKTVNSDMVFWRSSISRQIFMFSSELYRIVVFTKLRRRFIRGDQDKQLSFRFFG